MPRVRVLPYKSYSKSAKALARALPCKRLIVDPDRSRFKRRQRDVVINWGNSTQCHRATLNACSTALLRATNKLAFFQHFRGKDYVHQFWNNAEDIPDEAFPLVCRTVLSGHSGSGIVLSKCRDELVDAPLYVKYVPKTEEYRIHVGRLPNGSTTTIAMQQKKRRLNHDQPNWQIRNYGNGFTYAREGVDPPARVLDVAHDCLLHSGLDFGAVDVGYHEKYGVFVYEINSAPGLEGQTLDDYVKYFKGLLK
jgi:hypothetical protein